jgi:hypothetical protein
LRLPVFDFVLFCFFFLLKLLVYVVDEEREVQQSKQSNEGGITDEADDLDDSPVVDSRVIQLEASIDEQSHLWGKPTLEYVADYLNNCGFI